MFKKLIVLMCLICFAPAAVGAQGLAAIAPSAANEQSAPASPNLTLAADKAPLMLMAAADASQRAAVEKAPEQKPKVSSFEWSNFGEVHLGGYRWVWWVGAIAALIAIHAGK